MSKKPSGLLPPYSNFFLQRALFCHVCNRMCILFLLILEDLLNILCASIRGPVLSLTMLSNLRISRSLYKTRDDSLLSAKTPYNESIYFEEITQLV